MGKDMNERAAQHYPNTTTWKNPMKNSTTKTKEPPTPIRPFTNMNGINVYPETKISYVEENPKRKNSAAHTRFAKYMKAKTVAEFEKFGGTRADLKYDHSKEYVKIAK